MSTSRFPFSEKDMGVAFNRYLCRFSKRTDSLGFSEIVAEAQALHGRPDFVALKPLASTEVICRTKRISRSSLRIVRNLHPHAKRTLNYLKHETSLPHYLVVKLLDELQEKGVAKMTPTGSFTLGVYAPQLMYEFWAFELKLDSPKRAIFQAQRAKSFAERVVIVVPPGQAKSYDKFQLGLRRWGIGIVEFNPLTNQLQVKRRSRRSPALHPRNQRHVLSSLMDTDVSVA